MNDNRENNELVLKQGPKVSIIIPVYNTKDYLAETLNCMLTQTYQNIEIILVDDGSSDGSNLICDEYVKIDSRLCVYHTENHGVSHARNYGLDHASGEYVMFVDSDDLVKPEYVQIMLEAALKTEADVVVCKLMHGSLKSVTDFGHSKIKEPLKHKSFSIFDYRPNNYYFHDESQGALFSLSLTDGVRFDQDLWIGEDLLFFHQLLKRAGKYTFVDEELYYYRYRKDSAYHSNYSPKRTIEITARERVLALFEDMPENMRREFRAVVGCFCKRHYIMALNAEISDRDLKKMLHKKIWKYCGSVLKSKEMATKSKISYLLFACSPELYVKVRRL